MSLNILIIDDDSGITGLLKNIGSRSGYNVSVLNNSTNILSSLTKSYDLIFLELNMPSMDGIEVMRVLSDQKITANLVLMSGFDRSVLNTAHELAEAHCLNVLSHISKPFKVQKIQEIFEQVELLMKQGGVQSIEGQFRELSEPDLREALQHKRIEVFYQPQMDLKTQRIIGLEALCRLRSKTGELIPPDNFIPLAEKIGVIHNLTLLVANIIAQDYADISAQYHELTISINVSTRDLDFLTFPEELHSIFSQQGVDVSTIVVEVTGTLLVHDLRRELDVLARMRLKGFKVSIDDFGKGAATLEHIKYFPATEIKIDKDYVQSLGQKDKSHVIVIHTLNLAHQLVLDVVAKGIEDQDTADWLTSNNCDIGQGYWLSRPVPKAEIIDFLQQKKSSVELDSTFSLDDSEIELNSSEKEEQISASVLAEQATLTDDGEFLVSTILPLTGLFSFIGNSQLYGIKSALNEYHLEGSSSDTKIKIEVFDDESDIEKYCELSKRKLSSRSLACLGGVFTLGNAKRFINAALRMNRAVIGPFSGSVLLRNQEWKNIFNVRPSYEDELKCLVDELNRQEGKIILVYPENTFGHRAKMIVDRWLNIESLSYGTDSRTLKYLIQDITVLNAQHIIFIGSSKTLVDLVRETKLLGSAFYTISLVGLGSLVKSLGDCNGSVSVTVPIEDYQANTFAASQFRKYLKPLLFNETKKYMNSISFEAYLNTKVLITALKNNQTYSRTELIQNLENIQGSDIGLNTPITWAPETRQFLHHVSLLKDKICSSR